MALTDKQARFVQEYLIDLNATQAAIRAGYSVDTAGAIGHELLKNPKIENAISEHREARGERTRIDADWLLKRLADEAEADVNDIYADDGTLLPVNQWPMIWRKGLVAGIDIAEERDEAGNTIAVVRKIKVSDRVKRLELIGKHIGVSAFEERIRHSGSMGITVLQDDANL